MKKGKYNKDFREYINKCIDSYLNIYPLDSRLYKKLNWHYTNFITYLRFSGPIKKPRKDCFGFSVCDTMKTDKLKEILNSLLQSKLKSEGKNPVKLK